MDIPDGCDIADGYPSAYSCSRCMAMSRVDIPEIFGISGEHIRWKPIPKVVVA